MDLRTTEPTICVGQLKRQGGDCGAGLRAIFMRNLVIACLLGLSSGFLSREATVLRLIPKRVALHLIPIEQCTTNFPILTNSERTGGIDRHGKFGQYELSLVEESDLPDVSRFIIETFGAQVIKLSRDLSSFERMLMTPAVELVNGYSGIVVFAEVLAGLRSRLGFRLRSKQMDLTLPAMHMLSRDEQISMAACTSVVLVLAKNRSSDNKDWHIDVIASVELCLQPCDAKIPFSFPWIDRIERRLASAMGLNRNQTRDLQPYLSSLCVDESYRGKGFGRALVRCVERIASTSWGYSRLYLHVDADNKAAMELYKSEGYRDVGRRWNPFWAGKSADIGYFVKKINSAK